MSHARGGTAAEQSDVTVADTVGQARLLVEDEYEWAKNNAPNQNLEDVFAEQINTEPEVYDLPAGYFLDIS